MYHSNFFHTRRSHANWTCRIPRRTLLPIQNGTSLATQTLRTPVMNKETPQEDASKTDVTILCTGSGEEGLWL
ncbi:hypothetical protein BaRGS_00013788, partial [Batillaria attramentaria]